MNTSMKVEVEPVLYKTRVQRKDYEQEKHINDRYNRNIQNQVLQRRLHQQSGIQEAKTPVKFDEKTKQRASDQAFQEETIKKVSKSAHGEKSFWNLLSNKPVSVTPFQKNVAEKECSTIKTDDKDFTVQTENQNAKLWSVKNQFLKRLEMNKKDNSDDDISEGNMTIAMDEKGRVVKTQKNKDDGKETIGVGAPPLGQALKKVVAKIVDFLNNDVGITSVAKPRMLSVTIPKFVLSNENMKKPIADMNDPEFWLQQALKNEDETSKIEYANVYYRQGLLKNPESRRLMYNLARNNMILCKFKQALIWFEFGLLLKPRWVNGLVGVAITYLEMGYYSRAVEYITAARKNYKNHNHQEEKCHFAECEIIFLRATMIRQNGDARHAATIYDQIATILRMREMDSFKKILLSSFILVLNDDRKLMIDSFNDIKDYFNLINDDMQGENQLSNTLLLSSYSVKSKKYNEAKQEAPRGRELGATAGIALLLDWDNYRRSLETLIYQKYFFRRFRKKILYDYLRNGRIQSYMKNDVVYLNGRVGIVLSGQAFVKNHHGSDLCKPRILFKATEGHVLGFGDGESFGGLTVDPLTWIIAQGTQTEILWLSPMEFSALWDLQKYDTPRQGHLQQLEANPRFAVLSKLTKYFLVYEAMSIETFTPGELVQSLDQRSPFNSRCQEFYKDRYTRFKIDVIDKRKQENKDGKNSRQNIRKVQSIEFASPKDDIKQEKPLHKFDTDISRQLEDYENNKEIESQFDFPSDDNQSELDEEYFGDMLDEKMSDKDFLKLRGKMKVELMRDFDNAIETYQKDALKHQTMARESFVRKQNFSSIEIQSSKKYVPLPKTDLNQPEQVSISQFQKLQNEKKQAKKNEKERLFALKIPQDKAFTKHVHSQCKYDLCKAHMQKVLRADIIKKIKYGQMKRKHRAKYNEAMEEGLKSGKLGNCCKAFSCCEIARLAKMNEHLSSAQMDTLNGALEEIITVRENVGHIQIEPNAWCFIEHGDAVVYNKEAGGIMVRMGPGSFFGDSYLTRKVSHQTLGDVRAGLRNLKVLKFNYSDVERIVTFPELAALRQESVQQDVLQEIYALGKKKGIEDRVVIRY